MACGRTSKIGKRGRINQTNPTHAGDRDMLVQRAVKYVNTKYTNSEHVKKNEHNVYNIIALLDETRSPPSPAY